MAVAFSVGKSPKEEEEEKKKIQEVLCIDPFLAKNDKGQNMGHTVLTWSLSGIDEDPCSNS